MGRTRTDSAIWSIAKEDLVKIVEVSNSVSEVLRELGYTGGANNHRVFYRRCQKDQIDISHLKERSRLQNKEHLVSLRSAITTPFTDILVENSPYRNRSRLKVRLLREGLLEEKCSECGSLPTWRNKRLPLILDHINGVADDNRIENLRLLCPNCNSQTETFAGKNKGSRTTGVWPSG